MCEAGRKKEVQEEPVTMTVLFAAGQMNHPETLVWSHFYEHTHHSVWFSFLTTIWSSSVYFFVNIRHIFVVLSSLFMHINAFWL